MKKSTKFLFISMLMAFRVVAKIYVCSRGTLVYCLLECSPAGFRHAHRCGHWVEGINDASGVSSNVFDSAYCPCVLAGEIKIKNWPWISVESY